MAKVPGWLLLFGKAGKFEAIIRRQHANPARTVAIGDEVRDLEAARKVGVAASAVDWGYATVDLLRAAAHYLFTLIDDIRRAIAG